MMDPGANANTDGAFVPDDDAPAGRLWLALIAGAVMVALFTVVVVASGKRGGPPAVSNAGNNQPQTAPSHAGLALDDPDVCAACHVAIAEEWRASQHRTSRTDDAMSTLSIFIRSDPAAPECVACHRPRPIPELPRTLDDPGGATQSGAANPLPWARPDRDEDGVDCAACHVRFGDVVGAGRSTAAARDRAGCLPQVEPMLRESLACANCHQSYLPGTKHGFDEWAADGLTTQTCSDCHMPRVDGGPAGGPGQHRSHTMPGGHDPAFVRAGMRLSLTADRSARRVIATLENLGTGHRLPTGYRIRRVELRVVLLDAVGTQLAMRDYSLQKPTRWAGADGFQLPHGKTQEFVFGFDDEQLWATAAVARVEALYKLWPRDDGVRVGEAEVQLDR